MTPLTKMSRQIVGATTIPSVVREAFRIAQQERPGPVHLELPEDIAGEEAPDLPPVPPHPIEIPVANPIALDRATALILDAERPLIMLGAAASRPRLAEALSNFVRRVRIPFFNTQMGKGAVVGGSNLYIGTAALSERDYVHKAIDKADLILPIGHDTVEKPPFFMGPAGPKVIHVGYVPAAVEEVFAPQSEVVGDVGPSVALLADRLTRKLKNGSALSPEYLPTLDLETPPFWRYPMTTRSTALCSSERIFASFRGSRLTPERSSECSDLGARIHWYLDISLLKFTKIKQCNIAFLG
jgi:acetolactate synthase-1/2/3 large subunit